MKKIFLALLVFIFSITTSFAYELTDKDYKFVDKVEDKIISLIEKKPNLTAEKVVNILVKYADKKAKSARLKEILYTIADDLEYEYFLGDYAEIDLDKDYTAEIKEKAPKVVVVKKPTKKIEDKNSETEDYEDYENSETDGYSEEEYEKMQDNYSASDDDYEEENNTKVDDEDENLDEDDEEVKAGDENIDPTYKKDVLDKMDAVYSINGDSLKLISGKTDKQHTEVFKLFTTLIPKEYRTHIVKYKVYDNPEDDTYAFVDQDIFDKTKWTLVLNLSTFYIDGELDYEESVHTLVHEFTHVLTLGPKQVNYKVIDEDKCDNYMLMEGCLYNKAYLNGFIGQFWKDTWAKYKKDPNAKFYKEGKFVTDYAATNPGEDIAESFTYFVLKDKPASSKLMKDQKLLFFYKQKELVKLRNQIRAGLAKLSKEVGNND